MVVLQPKVVIYVIDLDCPAEVPILESRVEHQDVLMHRYIDFSSGSEVALVLEPGHVLVHYLFVVGGEVPLSCLVRKE